MNHFLKQTYTKKKQKDGPTYEESVCVDCVFESCTAEGAQIDAVFVDCKFCNHDWYWCIGHSPTFIRCTFDACDPRGSFFSASFIECKFIECNTGEDNLGGKTEWENCTATGCYLDKTELPLIQSESSPQLTMRPTRRASQCEITRPC